MKLVIDDVIFNYQQIFSEFGEIVALPGKSISAEDVKDADILIVRSRTQVNKALLEHSSVRFVGSAVAGLDHIDLPYLQQCGIAFADAGGSNANAVAEYVISAILNAYSVNYQDKILGIIGVGNVGKALDVKAKKLGMRTLLNDPPRQEQEQNAELLPLEEVLTKADIISVHTPLTTSGKYPSYHLLAAQNFALIKENAMIINAARGGVIDEEAWLTHSGVKIVDCWQNEPHLNTVLIAQATLATQHIAGHSVDAKLGGSLMIYQALCQFLNNTPKNHTLEIQTPCYTQLPLLEAINKIYDFTVDDKILRTGSVSFEEYRRNYPQRYEWQHFGILL